MIETITRRAFSSQSIRATAMTPRERREHLLAARHADGKSAAQTRVQRSRRAGWFGWYANHHVGGESASTAAVRVRPTARPLVHFKLCAPPRRLDDIAPSLYKPMMLVYGRLGLRPTRRVEGFPQGWTTSATRQAEQLALPLSRGENVKALYAASWRSCPADATATNMGFRDASLGDDRVDSAPLALNAK